MSSNNPSQQFSRYADRPHRTDAPIRPGTILTTRDPFAEVLAFMRRLANEKFYGVCSVCFRDGEIQTVRTEQTIRLGALATVTVLPSEPTEPISNRTPGDDYEA
jgi:hypothetical protein